MQIIYRVNKKDCYHSIRQLLKEKYEMSDRLILKLKTNKRIYLNENLTYVNHNLKFNDVIKINMDFQEDNSNIAPSNIPLDIVYEDDYYLIINKPANIVIHPSILHYANSLSNGVKYYFDNIRLKRKIRPVNRLDRDTSRISRFC